MIRPTSVLGGVAFSAALLYAVGSAPLYGQAQAQTQPQSQTQTPPSAPDIPAKFTAPTPARDYERREV